MADTLTVIPAKLGSTRLPQKNILPLAGKPLLRYSIEAALASGVCGEVMVSTESGLVADVAREGGAQVPFMGPDALGRDPYGVVDVCTHVLDEYARRGREFERLVVLLPTCPFRSPGDIAACVRLFEERGARFLMSVSETADNPWGALRFGGEGQDVVVPCFPEGVGKKRHELPVTYRCNGAVGVYDVAAYRETGTDYGTPLHAYVMPWQRSVDIDNEVDFRFAEFMLEKGMV